VAGGWGSPTFIWVLRCPSEIGGGRTVGLCGIRTGASPDAGVYHWGFGRGRTGGFRCGLGIASYLCHR